MKKKSFPEKVTKENASQIAEQAKKTLRRQFWMMVGVSGIYGILLLFLIFPLLFFIFGWAFAVSYPQWTAATLRDATFVICIVLLPLVSYVLLDLTMLFFEKFLGLPTSEEAVFASSFIIANHLAKNEKTEAVAKVDSFVTSLSQFLANRHSLKREAYSKEFKLLIRGKTQIARMILFSKETISETFTNFGLSFVRGEDQKAFSELTRLVEEVKKQGEPQGRYSGLLAFVSRTKSLILLVTALIELVVVLLKVMGKF